MIQPKLIRYEMTELGSNFEVRPNFGDPNCHVWLPWASVVFKVRKFLLRSSQNNVYVTGSCHGKGLVTGYSISPNGMTEYQLPWEAAATSIMMEVERPIYRPLKPERSFAGKARRTKETDGNFSGATASSKLMHDEKFVEQNENMMSS